MTYAIIIILTILVIAAVISIILSIIFAVRKEPTPTPSSEPTLLAVSEPTLTVGAGTSPTCAMRNVNGNVELQTEDGRKCATTTRYWDCSRPTCSWNPNCGKGGNITDSTTCANYSGDPDGTHNSLYNQLYSQNGSVYTTAAASGSFGLTASGGMQCGKCYELEITGQCGNPYDAGQYGCNNAANEKVKGTKFTTMVTNLCPDWNNGKGCPPTPQDKNVRDANYHFDLALVGGGLGAQGKCSDYRYHLSGDVKSIEDCSKASIVDPIFTEGCKAYFNQLGGMDNPMVAFREITCPSVPSYQQLNTGK